MSRKYPYQMTAPQRDILDKMQPGVEYTAKELGCYFKTLKTLEKRNLLVSSNWEIDHRTDWSETVKFKLAEENN